MKTFDIYIPAKFYWTRTRVMYTIITVLILACLAVKYLFLVPEEEPIYRYFGYAIFGACAFGFCCVIWGMPRVKPIAGKLEGTFRFEEEGIYLAETFHTIEDIKKIEFQGVDWQGLFERATFCDYFDNRLSNGSGNKLIIEMADGKKIITRFVKLYACELADVKSIFISYYLKDKIGYLQLIDNLCTSDPEEQKELKRMKGIGLRAAAAAAAEEEEEEEEEELKRMNFK